MKKLFLSIVAICSIGMSAQDNPVNPNNNNLGAIATYGANGNFVSAKTIINPSDIDGSEYLFDDWSYGVIETSDNRRFSVQNVNYNIKKDAFVAKFAKDSIFTFDVTNVDRIILNEKKFKSILDVSKGYTKNYEVIADGKNIDILKDHFLEIRQGSPNPMVMNKSDKYLKSDKTYIRINEYSIIPFKLKRKSFKTIFKDKYEEVNKYVKQNDLSYRDEEDLQKIVSYYDSL